MSMCKMHTIGAQLPTRKNWAMTLAIFNLQSQEANLHSTTKDSVKPSGITTAKDRASEK